MKFYFLLFFISFIATYLVRIIAAKMNVYDIPTKRSSHTIPTPRGGGIAFIVCWYIGITYEHFFWNSIPTHLYYAFLSGLVLVILGIIDDVWGVSPKIRIIFHVLTSLIAIFFLGGLQKVDLGFSIVENKYILSAFALIGMIWAINLFNFLDGIDGYLGSEVVFISIAIGLLCSNSMVLILGSVILGFLIWNWQRAKVFMGDVGSTFLGFTIAVFAIYYQNEDITSILIWIILSSVFWFDATLTLYRRYKNKEKLSVAHNKHAYQRIVQAGFSHQKTVIHLLILNLLFLGLAFLSLRFEKYGLIFLGLASLVMFAVVKWVDKLKKFE